MDKPAIATCPHVNTATVVDTAGNVLVEMTGIDREYRTGSEVKTFDCEVCRKLLAFDEMLAAIHKFVFAYENSGSNELPGLEYSDLHAIANAR